MDASKKQREPVAFKSLAELKRFIRPGVEFKTVSHANHADMVGLTRVVTTVQTVGFYSKIKDQPEHPFSTCNHGKGFYTDFGKAGNYIFDGTTVKVKDTRKQDRGVIYELEFYDREQNMEETMMDRKMVNFIKEQYPPGTRIRLNSMDDPYAPILPGTEGEVDFVDDAGQLHMKWDNGRSLALIPGEDSFTVLPPKLTTLKLYMPLTADLYARNEYGDFDDSSTLLEGRELRGYQDQITAALVKNRMPEEAERGLMHWYDEADSVDRKVRSAVFTVEERDRQFWGVAECRVAGELSETELEILKEYLTGQASDGWGEGFALPPANKDMRRVFAYLIKHRSIARDVVARFVKAGLLYEDAEYHNAVFVGTDTDGVPRHAHKRSANSYGKAFRLNVEGSDPRYSFHYVGTGRSLYVFEAPIDMLSFITLYPENWQRHSYVACCGTSIQPVLQMLEQVPQLDTILLCLDNDEAGHQASRRMREQLEMRYSVERLIPENKDWNDDLTLSGENAQGFSMNEMR